MDKEAMEAYCSDIHHEVTNITTSTNEMKANLENTLLSVDNVADQMAQSVQRMDKLDITGLSKEVVDLSANIDHALEKLELVNRTNSPNLNTPNNKISSTHMSAINLVEYPSLECTFPPSTGASFSTSSYSNAVKKQLPKQVHQAQSNTSQPPTKQLQKFLCDESKTIAIENILNYSKFIKLTKDTKKEFNKYHPGVKIVHSKGTRRGTLLIELQTEEEAKAIVKQWNSECFSDNAEGTVNKTHATLLKDKNCKGIMYDIDHEHSEDFIANEVKKSNLKMDVTIRRFMKGSKKMSTVMITFGCKEDLDQALTKTLTKPLNMESKLATAPKMCIYINQPLRLCNALNASSLTTQSLISLEKFLSSRNIRIIALQETRVDSLPKNQFPGFSMFLNNKGLGVGLAISNYLKPQFIPDLNDTDCSVVWVSICINGTATLVASAYCTPETSSTHSLHVLLENIRKAKHYADKLGIKNLLILGDFNARSPRWGDRCENPRGRLLKNFCESFTDCSLLSPPGNTFVSPQGGSIIDLCLVFGPLHADMGSPHVDHQNIHELFTGAPVRGHVPVINTIINKCSQSKEVKTVFNYDAADWRSWRTELDLISLQKLSEIESLVPPPSCTSLVLFFQSTLLKACENHIPTKKCCIHSKPYWSNNLTTLSNRLRNAQTLYLSKASPLHKKTFEDCKLEFKATLIKEKNEWIHDQLEGLNVHQCQEFWKKYKSLYGEKDDMFMGNLICPDTEQLQTTDSAKEKLLFNTFFGGKHLEKAEFDNIHYSKVLEEVNNLKENNFHIDDEPGDILEAGLEVDIINEIITIDEIVWSISKQKCTNKSKDGTNIHPKMLKHLPNHALKLLCHIYNIVLNSGNWEWKESFITFIKKSDKPSYMCPGAYRPLAISPYLGKILERILDKRLRLFCGLENIIDESQEGFLPDKNTTRYLYKMLSCLHEIKRRKMTALLLLIDFEKAFDSVSVPCLIAKLYHLGIKGKMLRLLNSFLSDRYVYLRVNTFTGRKRRCLLIGVPQGSVLSPLLFIIFISDLLRTCNLPTTVTGCTQCFKFADDGSVTVVGDSFPEVQEKMQILCEYIADWCKKWRLIVNCSRNKTEIIIVSPKHGYKDAEDLPKIKMGNTVLEYVEKSKVLGIIIDETLSFAHHARSVLKSCWHAWYKVSDKTSRKRGLNTSSLSILFKTVVLSKLLYASPVWLSNNIDVFKDFMSKALLRITGAQFHPTKYLKEILVGIPPLKLVHEQIVIKFILKCLFQGDNVAGRIFQVECTPQHPFNSHIRLTKEFIYFTNNELNSRFSRTSLIEFDRELFVYHKDKILEYTCKKWDDLLKENISSVCKDDPYNLNQLHSDEHLQGYINTWNSLKNPLFKRHESRIDNTNLADFLHGHSLRFQDFTYSFLKVNKNRHAPLCLECTANPDSPHHQLFECPNLQSEYRDRLTASVGNLETNFHLPIIFHTDIYNNGPNVTMGNGEILFTEEGATSYTCALCETRKALKHLVKDILSSSTSGNWKDRVDYNGGNNKTVPSPPRTVVEVICSDRNKKGYWTAVKRGFYISLDIENIPLEIKTDSALGSGEKVQSHGTGLETEWTSTLETTTQFQIDIRHRNCSGREK
ncbi:hypothetical protein ACHWQZ_G005480 [Mnemiopsis leidyi]